MCGSDGWLLTCPVLRSGLELTQTGGSYPLDHAPHSCSVLFLLVILWSYLVSFLIFSPVYDSERAHLSLFASVITVLPYLDLSSLVDVASAREYVFFFSFFSFCKSHSYIVVCEIFGLIFFHCLSHVRR